MSRGSIIPMFVLLFAGAGCVAGAIVGVVWSTIEGLLTIFDQRTASSLTTSEVISNALIMPLGLSIIAAPIGAVIGCILGVLIGIVAGIVTYYYFGEMQARNTFNLGLGMIAGGIALTVSTVLLGLSSGGYEDSSNGISFISIAIITASAWIASQVIAKWYVKNAAPIRRGNGSRRVNEN